MSGVEYARLLTYSGKHASAMRPESSSLTHIPGQLSNPYRLCGTGVQWTPLRTVGAAEHHAHRRQRHAQRVANLLGAEAIGIVQHEHGARARRQRQ